ncbi:daunorubicin ABC transporter ATP-binding protein [Sulfolobales archaeon HS-7]|nr:daunorubicin ABC transporter ATP-binding protein [Sulfolobales archaeon HS-7]
MNLKFILTFAWFYGWSGLKRGPVYVLSYLSLPLSLLLLVFIISRGELLSYGIIGGMIAVVASNALSLVSDNAFFKLELRMIDLLVATEVGPVDYMIGLMLGDLVFSFPGIVLYIILGIILKVFPLIEIPPIFGVLILVMFSTSSLGIITSSRLKHVRHSWGLSSFLSIVFTIIPPLYYPYQILPKIILYILMATPVTPASVIVQSGLDGPSTMSSVAVLLLETALFTICARYLTQWEEK